MDKQTDIQTRLNALPSPAAIQLARVISRIFFTDCVEKLGIKCDGNGAAIIRRQHDWSVDDCNSMEIRRSSLTKFDSTGVYYALDEQGYNTMQQKEGLTVSSMTCDCCSYLE